MLYELEMCTCIFFIYSWILNLIASALLLFVTNIIWLIIYYKVLCMQLSHLPSLEMKIGYIFLCFNVSAKIVVMHLFYVHHSQISKLFFSRWSIFCSALNPSPKSTFCCFQAHWPP